MGGCLSLCRGDRHLPNGQQDTLASVVRNKKDFSFDGQEFSAKVVDVYDGDTIRIVFNWRGEYVQWMARMVGYDSPEMRQPVAEPNRDRLKAAAVAARDALRAQILDKVVIVRCGKFEKYGRILVTVFAPCGLGVTNVNEWMLSRGYGRPYDGGKKTNLTFAE